MLLIRTSRTCRTNALVVPPRENGALGNGTKNISANRDIDKIVMVRNPWQSSEESLTYLLDRRVEMGVPPIASR
jgi:hypothetical protein